MTQAHEEGKETNERTNGPSSPCLLRHPHTTAGLGREGPGPRRTSGGAPGLFLPARAEGEQPYIESCATLARGPIAPAFPAPPVYRSADGGGGDAGTAAAGKGHALELSSSSCFAQVDASQRLLFVVASRSSVGGRPEPRARRVVRTTSGTGLSYA